ncbi:MAG: class I SAM-dependent methyltransferase [Nitrospirae bacterium]|nr:class I SAM-dependent methyltransferase [Nitrospirota bacterium]
MADDYFAYLSERSFVRILLRRLFMMPIVRFFKGRVLDIGSGIGEFLSYYPEAVGVDINADCVAQCRNKGLACVQADVAHLPFDADLFEGVLLNNVLEHLNDADSLFHEIRRVLRDNGRLVIELPGSKGFAHDKTHVRFWGKNDIVPYLAGLGFCDICISYFPIPAASANDLFIHNKLRVYAVLRK